MSKKIVCIMCNVLLFLSTLLGTIVNGLGNVEVNAAEVSGTTYYVDATGGDDSNAGTSEDAAWKSFEKSKCHHFCSRR